MPQTPEEQKAFFDANGYLVVPDLISRAALDLLRDQVDRVLDGRLKPLTPSIAHGMDDFDIQWEPELRGRDDIPREHKVRVVFHLAHTHPFFWAHATRPEILDVVANLLGPDLRFYTDQMFVKPARHGSNVPFHQDSGYWPNAQANLLSCWFAIDDATVANGCVRVIPGTHTQLLPHHHFPEHPTQSMGLLESEVEVAREIPVEIPAGGAMFHHSRLIHRSFANTSDRGRRGLVTIYLPADLEFLKPWPFPFGFRLVRGQGRPDVGPQPR